MKQDALKQPFFAQFLEAQNVHRKPVKIIQALLSLYLPQSLLLIWKSP